MIKKLYFILKKVLFSFFFLYAYNVIASPIGGVVPLNIITIGTLTILGIPSLFSFVMVKLLLF